MFILQIVIILLATKLAGQLSIRLGQPSVLGKILIGIVIGPAILGWVQDTEVIKIFAQIGVLLLMFLAGLETDLSEMNRNLKAATAVAIGGIIAPMILGYAGGQLFGLSSGESVFIGLLLSATSVSISVQTLRELGWLNSKEGSTLLGAAVLDDIIVVILMAIAMSFFVSSDVSISMVIGKKILFFIALFIAAKWLIKPFIHIFSTFKVTEAVVSAGLIVGLGFAYFAESLGIAGIIGTFFAGLAIGQTEFKKEIEHKLEPIASTIFVPVFFVSIGLSVSFEGIENQISFLVIFSTLAIVSKWIGAGLGARMSGFNNKSSLGIGAGMISRGEVALILAAIGLEGGLLPKDYYTSLIFVVILTTVVTPPLLKMTFGKRHA